MASKTVVELFDDLDGGRADETVTFALDGVEYEIDLSKANATALRNVFTAYIEHGHRVTNRPRGVTKTTAPGPVGGSKPVKGKAKAVTSTNASMTAEIRRLASESARKVSEANQAVVKAEQDDVEPDLFSTAPELADDDPGRNADSTVGPVPALIIPFQEAGL